MKVHLLNMYLAAGQVAQPYVEVPKNTRIDLESMFPRLASSYYPAFTDNKPVTVTSAKKTTQKVWISDKLVSQQEDSEHNLLCHSYNII